MSRSYRKTPIVGAGDSSEKQDKQEANRKERRINKEILKTGQDEPVLVLKRQVSNVWAIAKDGKRWFNPDEFPKFLRK